MDGALRTTNAEDLLRADVFETIRGAQLDHIDWSVVPPPESEIEWAVKELGKLVLRLAMSGKVSPEVRAELLVRLLDAGMSPDARFGGRAVNGIEVRPDGGGRSSLLMLCTQQGFPLGMQVLIERGASALAASADHGFTIVDQAVTNLDSECLRRALQAAPYSAYVASPSGPTMPANLFGSVTASWAGRTEGAEVLRLLIEHGLGRVGLLTNMVKGGRDCAWVIDALVGFGCDPREEGNAPAIAAASSGKVAMLGRLLEHGVDPDLKGARGATLMRYGAKHAEVKSLLRAWRVGRAIETAVNELLHPIASQMDGVSQGL